MRVRGYADGTPCWAAVATSNVEASRAFYSALFGWEFVDGRFALEGRAVAGVRDRGHGPAAWLMSVSTDNADQVTQVVERARGHVRAAPQPTGPSLPAAVFGAVGGSGAARGPGADGGSAPGADGGSGAARGPGADGGSAPGTDGGQGAAGGVGATGTDGPGPGALAASGLHGTEPAEGTAAIFSDPAGAIFSVWQRGTFGGAQVAMEPGAICWYELATPDLAGADDFYSTVFGWRVHEAESAPGDPYFEFRHNDDAVAGLLPIDHRFPTRDMRAHWTVCFMVDDCAQSCDRAVDLGGVVARKPMTVATGWYARLADPAGAHFAIIELAEELRMDF